MVFAAINFSRMKREATSPCFWRDVAAELVAMFFLMSVQSALPLDWGKPQTMGNVVQISLGMGFVVACLAWVFGDFGGGHINPAVSISMLVNGSVTLLRCIFYIIAQIIGALIGASFVKAVTPKESRGNLAATGLGEGVEPWMGFLVEAWTTALLVFTILGSTNAKRKGNVYMPTLFIGFAVALDIMAAINHTGASMNPARSFGPAVVVGYWDDHWVYWAGPIAGGVFATVLYSFLFDRIKERKGEEKESKQSSNGIENGGAGTDFGEDRV